VLALALTRCIQSQQTLAFDVKRLRIKFATTSSILTRAKRKIYSAKESISGVLGVILLMATQ